MQKTLDNKKYYINNIVSQNGALLIKGCVTMNEDTSISLDIYINTIFYKTIIANELIEDGLYGFTLSLPEDAVAKEENTIGIKLHNTYIHLFNSPLKYKHKAKYIFDIGHKTRERIAGWVLDENFKNRVLKLQLFINNNFVLETENLDKRKDIESIYGVLKVGFHFDIPDEYQNMENIKIDIKILENGKFIDLLYKSITFTTSVSSKDIDSKVITKSLKKDKKIIAVLGTPHSGVNQLAILLANNSQSSLWFLPYETRKNFTPALFTDFLSIENQYSKVYPNDDKLKDTIIISEFISDSKNIEFIEKSFRNLKKNGVETKIIWLLRDVNDSYLSQNNRYFNRIIESSNEDDYVKYIEFIKNRYKQLIYFLNKQNHIMISYKNVIEKYEIVINKLIYYTGLEFKKSKLDINLLTNNKRYIEYDNLLKNNNEPISNLNAQQFLFVNEFNKLVNSIEADKVYNLENYKKDLIDTFFDKKYYLKIYPDIAKADIDPIEHYITHKGWRENRDPNSRFCTKVYMENVHDGTVFNPFIHYCLIGRYEVDFKAFSEYSIFEDLILINPEDYEIKDDLLLEAPYFENPEVSIIIPTYNQQNYTLACIESIIRNTKDVSYEIIVADDKSPDVEARELNKYFKNIVFTSNEKNMGFLLNCKNAVKLAKGKYLHFLNNDTNVQPRWLSSLINVFKSFDSVGMVGSRLVYPDGRQQDAGGIVWDDASAWNFGRLDGVDNPEYNYVRESDYVTGASMLICKTLWEKIGGFDERYVPAYYEDTDLAFEVRRHGYKTMFQPKSIVVHFEGVSNGTDLESGTKQYQTVNKEKFFNKWKDELKENHFLNGKELFLARDCSSKKKHMLFVDHYLPHYDEDAGSKVAYQYLKMFAKSGIQVHFMGDNFDSYSDTPYLDALTQKGIEVLYGNWYRANWDEWFMENGKYFDYVVLSRPHIAVKYIDTIRSHSDAKIIYFGHDLHFLREYRGYKVKKDVKYLKGSENWKKIELDLIKEADVSYFFSTVEKEEILKVLPKASVDVVPLYIYNKFIERKKLSIDRKNIMFVGGFNHTPNVDAMIWFVKEVWPYIERAVKGIHFYIIGSKPTDEVLALSNKNITVTGFVEDSELAVYYQNCRVSVAPLRYGAGVKGKVVDAIYNGMPMVTTSIGAEGLIDYKDILMVDDDAEKFAKKVILLYKNSNIADEFSKKELQYIKNHFSQKVAKEKISNIFGELDGN